MDLNTIITILESIILDWWIPILFIGSFIEMSPLGWVTPGGVIVVTAAFFAWGSPELLIGIVLVSTLGGVLSFTLAYFLGKKTGGALVEKFKQESSAKRAQNILKKNGAVVLTTSMIAGMTRFWVAYFAGSQGYSFWLFLKYAFVSSLTWTSLMAIVGYVAGSERDKLEQSIASLGILSWILLMVAIGVIFVSAKKEKEITKKPLQQT